MHKQVSPKRGKICCRDKEEMMRGERRQLGGVTSVMSLLTRWRRKGRAFGGWAARMGEIKDEPGNLDWVKLSMVLYMPLRS